MKFLSYLRQAFIILTKTIFLIMCMYYLINIKKYHITINLPEVLNTFKIFQAPITFIENTRIFLIIIPMSIVISSLLYPQYKILNFFAMFFSVAGNLFTMIMNFNKGLLQEFFRIGWFTVYNEISFKKKTMIFESKFFENLELLSKHVDSKIDFKLYTDQFLKEHWPNTLTKIQKLSVEDIKSYADTISNHVLNNYTKHAMELQEKLNKAAGNNVPSTGTGTSTGIGTGISSYFTSTNVLIGIAIIGGFCLLGYYAYHTLHLTKDLAKESVDVNKRVGQVVEHAGGINSDLSVTNQSLTVMARTALDQANTLETFKTWVYDNLQQMSNNITNLTVAVNNITSNLQASIADASRLSKIDFSKYDTKSLIDHLLKIIDISSTQTEEIITLKQDIIKLQGVIEGLKSNDMSQAGYMAALRELQNLSNTISTFNSDETIKKIKENLQNTFNLLLEKHSNDQAAALEEFKKVQEKTARIIGKQEASIKTLKDEVGELKNNANESQTQLGDLKNKANESQTQLANDQKFFTEKLDALTNTQTTIVQNQIKIVARIAELKKDLGNFKEEIKNKIKDSMEQFKDFFEKAINRFLENQKPQQMPTANDLSLVSTVNNNTQLIGSTSRTVIKSAYDWTNNPFSRSLRTLAGISQEVRKLDNTNFNDSNTNSSTESNSNCNNNNNNE